MTKLTFKREKDVYGNFYYVTSTEVFEKVIIKKFYEYEVKAYLKAESGKYELETKYTDYCCLAPNLKEAKDLVGHIDEIWAQMLSVKNAEEKKSEEARKAYNTKVAELNEPFVVDSPMNVEVGKRYVAKFAKLNKNCTIGEYRYQCEDKGDFSNETCLVTKIVKFDNDSYDDFSLNLMGEHSCIMNAECGNGSDYEIPDVYKEVDFWNLPEYIVEQFQSKAYTKCVVVTAPNRNPLFIDTQGYNYARYVGII